MYRCWIKRKRMGKTVIRPVRPRTEAWRHDMKGMGSALRTMG